MRVMYYDKGYSFAIRESRVTVLRFFLSTPLRLMGERRQTSVGGLCRRNLDTSRTDAPHLGGCFVSPISKTPPKPIHHHAPPSS